ncbi:MAG: GMP synthase [Flavisolibacter sp.]|jgi:GMP synthase-like glutamine amidotransferase|nr:GMP synthase [Flavisolibacter sp.]
MKIAILDLYEGQANQGMRCIRQIIKSWSEKGANTVICDEFDVRVKNEVPDLSYDVYISSGGPGSPLDSKDAEWEKKYFEWIRAVEEWNHNPENTHKKYVFFICHSFQLACRYYKIGEVAKRKSTAFGVFPVHVLPFGQADPVFKGLHDPFFVVDSRDWQVIHPDVDELHKSGKHILCIEKYRPHIPYVQAIMGLRFDPYMLGTQFHPEADAIGMSMYLQTEEKKKIVIDTHGEDKWESMIQQLNDPDKIMYTYEHILPNFLSLAGKKMKQLLVA